MNLDTLLEKGEQKRAWIEDQAKNQGEHLFSVPIAFAEGSNGQQNPNHPASDGTPIARAPLSESNKKEKEKQHKAVGKSKNTVGTWKKIQRTTNTTVKDTLPISEAIGRKRGSGE